MIRVLHVLGGLGTGGAENLIMNWYRAIDRSTIQFDFLVRSDDHNFVEEIHSLGGEVYYTASFPRHALKNYRETDRLLRTGKWDVIHVHGNAALYMTALVLAKKYNVPCRIMHSHSVKAVNPLFSTIHCINRRKLNSYTTEQLACSQKAGCWMFGKNPFSILKNSISTDDFAFSQDKRCLIRKEFQLEEKFVVGHVGRFVESKNHSFVLRVFDQILKARKDAVLLLVGDGEVEGQVRSRVHEMGLDGSVVFAGRRNDIGCLMSAMDVFLFPSLYEGMPVVLIEAQANGLPCFVSQEAITDEVHITPAFHSISLKESAEQWAEQILSCSFGLEDRAMGKELVKQSGYDVRSVVNELETIYENGAHGGV